eukprot:4510908-Prymnesium_polylepis.1
MRRFRHAVTGSRSRFCYQHDDLAERSSNSSFNYGEVCNSSLKIEPAFAAVHCGTRGPAVASHGR